MIARGRALLPGLPALDWSEAASVEGAFSAGVAWGLPSPADLDELVARVPAGARVACVAPIRRGGARGALDRVLLVGSAHVPVELDDVCTLLFVHGVADLRVYELEARRNLVAVVGTRRP
jgi:hypothetical protein